MYNWESGYAKSRRNWRADIFLAVTAALVAMLAFFLLHPQIESINEESPWLINLLFIPSALIGILYGMRITEKAMRPSQTRGPAKRMIMKIFLFFFIIGGMFSTVSFAFNGGSVVPVDGIFERDPIEWGYSFIEENGGVTFLIISSIALMAAGTKSVVNVDGAWNRLFTFVGTFIFFTMLAMSFTQSNPHHSEIYLYTFYQAGVVGGALYEMNRLTRNINDLEDFGNGYI